MGDSCLELEWHWVSWERMEHIPVCRLSSEISKIQLGQATWAFTYLIYPVEPSAKQKAREISYRTGFFFCLGQVSGIIRRCLTCSILRPSRYTQERNEFHTWTRIMEEPLRTRDTPPSSSESSTITYAKEAVESVVSHCSLLLATLDTAN
jgi:hypothetical protein